MNVALRKVMTVSDYLAWGEAEGDGQRTELINGRIVALSPEQADRNRIKDATFSLFAMQSKRRACPAKSASTA